jgi:hypothetical protein
MNFARSFSHAPRTAFHWLLLMGLVLALRLSAAAPAPGATIPLSEIAAAVQKQYHGDGLAVRAGAGGAALRCVFQKLEGQVTAKGLWLSSTADQVAGTPFRVVAQSVGRNGAETGLLESIGQVEAQEGLARFVRPGLVEEYSVSAEGVRQDFIVSQRPAGKADLRVNLAVEGAAAESAGGGVRLVLAGSGRKLAYHRLNVTDALGHPVPARMEVKSPREIEVVVDDAAAVYPVRIDPTFTDANWISLGALVGIDGAVKAAITDGTNNLYVGGFFTIAGSAMAQNIARWDGTNWFALGSGINGLVHALALDSNGVLYAGGEFSRAGGENTPHIAKWDGSAWSGLDIGTDDTVYALAADHAGNVYAGGGFALAGSTAANHIAKWDGSAWSDLGGGTDDGVLSLAVDASGNLYAGGAFLNAGGAPASSIAKWNGTTWSPLGDGLNDVALSLTFDGAGNLYAGGAFTMAGSVAANYLARWDGTTWSPLGDGTDFVVFALAADGAGGVYAGGIFDNAGAVPAKGVAHWDGTAWADLAGSVTDHGAAGVYALAVAGSGNLFAGGDFLDVGGNKVGAIGQWNGSSWSALGAGTDDSVYALVADGSGNVYAGGAFTTIGGVSASFVAKWDGSSWSALGIGVDAKVFALLLDGAGNLYAGGDFTTAGGTAANHIAKWDGSSWSALGGGMDAAVYALARDSSGVLYAGGDFLNADGNPANYLAKWDGMTWTALGDGVESTVNALVVDGSGNLLAGGYFISAGGNPANYLAKWDGANWSAFPSEVGGQVFALSFDASGNLYVGGFFTNAGPVMANNIAKWDGSAWSALGDGTDGTVYALALDSAGNLYAGGYFFTAGSTVVQGVAKWDGADWSALGSGLDSGANALAVNSTGDLYVGGDFFVAGDKVSAFAARFLLNFAGMSVADDLGALEDGVGSVDFGTILYGSNTIRSFAITNSGNLSLTGILISTDGANAGDFSVDTSGMLTTLAPGDSTTFAVTFSPGGGGDRYAALHIASNAPGESNPFDVTLTGYGDVGSATIDLSNTSVDENEPAGTVVGTLGATDLDPADTFTFSLHCGCFDNALFQVVGNSLVTRGPFDYEATNSYIVFIHAVNAAGQSFDQSFGININDVNEAPSFGGYHFTALQNTAATIALPKLLARASDPENDHLILPAADSTSAQGGVVELLATSIRYTPPLNFTGTDSFSVTVSDGLLTTPGTVSIMVDNGPSGNGTTLLSITPAGPDVQLKFVGVPGAHYLVQRSETLFPPVIWTTLATVTADVSGYASYLDTSPPSPSYWRTITTP